MQAQREEKKEDEEKREVEKIKVAVRERQLGGGPLHPLWASLEEACAALGWTIDQIIEEVSPSNPHFPCDVLFAQVLLVCRQQGEEPPTKSDLKKMLEPQRPEVYQKFVLAKQELEKQAELMKEKKMKQIQEAIKKIGKCCMGFQVCVICS